MQENVIYHVKHTRLMIRDTQVLDLLERCDKYAGVLYFKFKYRFLFLVT
jgi:hypothetical protein